MVTFRTSSGIEQFEYQFTYRVPGDRLWRVYSEWFSTDQAAESLACAFDRAGYTHVSWKKMKAFYVDGRFIFI